MLCTQPPTLHALDHLARRVCVANRWLRDGAARMQLRSLRTFEPPRPPTASPRGVPCISTCVLLTASCADDWRHGAWSPCCCCSLVSTSIICNPGHDRKCTCALDHRTSLPVRLPSSLAVIAGGSSEEEAPRGARAAGLGPRTCYPKHRNQPVALSRARVTSEPSSGARCYQAVG